MRSFAFSFAASAALALLAAAVPASAAMVAEKIAYTVDGGDFEGVLVYDDGVSGARPGVVMAPNWMGVTDAAIDKAKMLAGGDYVMFVADMYGVGTRPANAQEAGQASGAVRADVNVERARINAAVDVLLKEGGARGIVDAENTAAIGFCFGGSNVLELARSGRDVKGVVSFHGSIKAAQPDAGRVKANILVLHGAADPAVPKADRDAFEAEMSAVPGVDWQLVAFSGAVHSFTDPGANTPGRAQYDEKTAKRAYAMMYDFFDELFGAGS